MTVIAIFIKNALEKKPLTIYGDGEQTRDFVNVKDVTSANIAAASSNKAIGARINIGMGSTLSINELATLITDFIGNVEVFHKPARKGDIYESVADITKARDILGYHPTVAFQEGLKEVIVFQRAKHSV